MLPVPLLWDLPLVAAMLPCRLDALKAWLKRWRALFPERQYRVDGQGREHRMLTSAEVRMIRARMLRSRDRARRGHHKGA